MIRPQVIFLDAVGTLFGVKGSVGEIYSQIAAQFGVEVAPSILDSAFRKSFKVAGLPAFPGVHIDEIQTQEFAWWLAIAQDTFEYAGVRDKFTDFDNFFADLFNHFATASPWIVYSDVIPALQNWQAKGIELGVLSNFDSRLYPVLKQLGLEEYFASVTISTHVGFAKPNPEIFEIALQKHQASPEQAWHIGDSHSEDYEAAQKVGLYGFWLRRGGAAIPSRTELAPVEQQLAVLPTAPITSLSDLMSLL